MKPCIRCKRVLPLSDFYAHPRMADGHLNKCKECQKREVKKARAANVTHYREYDREREQSTERKAQKATARQRYRRKHRQAVRAHNAVQRAVAAGTLVPAKTCEGCGKPNGTTRRERLHAHHDNYAKPLEVRWLCARCHNGK